MAADTRVLLRPWSILGAICLVIGAAIAAMFLFGPGPADEPAPPAPATAAPRSAPRFDPGGIAAMKQRFLAEPEIADLLFDDSRLSVTWQIGVVALPDDPLVGPIDYARIQCRHLREAGLVDADTNLRLVDLIALDQTPGNFRAASIAHVDCVTGDNLGI